MAIVDPHLEAIMRELTREDIAAMMPEGLVSGAALWARLGGPETMAAFRTAMLARPPSGTRARSGWMCGAALIIYKNRALGVAGRNMTANMTAHLAIFEPYLADFARCIISVEPRINVQVTKDPALPYVVNVPTALASQRFTQWCGSAWPDTGVVIPRGF